MRIINQWDLGKFGYETVNGKREICHEGETSTDNKWADVLLEEDNVKRFKAKRGTYTIAISNRKPPRPTTTTPIQIPKKGESSMTQLNVYFKNNSNIFETDADGDYLKETLKPLAEAMKANGNLIANVMGNVQNIEHDDNAKNWPITPAGGTTYFGPLKDIQNLRANTVKNFLVELGVPADRVNVLEGKQQESMSATLQIVNK
jgi:outer membrane protein OmpA-like peptidoglycan-associated protein